MYTVYILEETSKRKYYIGSTKDLDRRLQEHNSNKTISIKNRGPWKVIHSELYQTRSKAAKRELQIKSYKGGNAFKKLIG